MKNITPPSSLIPETAPFSPDPNNDRADNRGEERNEAPQKQHDSRTDHPLVEIPGREHDRTSWLKVGCHTKRVAASIIEWSLVEFYT